MNQPGNILVRFHEIALKGRNRPLFINALVRNIRNATVGMGVARVWASHLLIRLTLEPDSDWKAVFTRLKTISGIAKFASARSVAPEYPAIEDGVLEETKLKHFESFRITARRADKRFPLTSKELNIRLGAAVQSKRDVAVNLRDPELEVHVDVLPNDAFIYTNEFRGPGGLPVGTGGRVVTLMSGGIDSPVAAWRMIHRGCHSTLVHFHSFPLVEGRSREKAQELAELLTSYQYNTRLYLIPFAELQKQLVLSIPGELRIIEYRRFMLRIAERIAHKEKAKALISGESLGQVGSQTLQNIVTIEQAVDIPVLRPLVGMDKQEIILEAQNIGTYPISIMPDEDCCSLFVPRSPSTGARLGHVITLEEKLDINGMVSQALSDAEIRDYRWEGTTLSPQLLGEEVTSPNTPL